MSNPQNPSGHSAHEPLAEEPIDLGEFRAISNLLRQLDDPEPPEDLRARVMERVATEHSRPPGLQRIFRLQQPGIAAALAAGIAGYLFLGAPSSELLGTAPAAIVQNTGGIPKPAAEALMPRRVRVATGSASATPTRVVPNTQAAFGGDPMLAASRASTPSALPPLDRRLDHQIDRMLHQPDAFFRRLENIRQNERYLARLAERSARRGDSAAIALRVRNTGHPLAPKIAEQFLRASLAQSLSQPRAPLRPTDVTRQPASVYSH